MLGTCTTWSQSVHRELSKHICLSLSTQRNRHTLENIRNVHLARKVNIEILVNDIINGAFIGKHTVDMEFDRVEHLELCITQEEPRPTVRNESDWLLRRQQTKPFIALIIKMFPNIHTLSMRSNPNRSILWAEATTSIFSSLSSYILARQEVPELIFAAYGCSLSSHHIPVVTAGLTQIKLGMVTWSEEGHVEVVHRSRATLRKLEISYARTTQCLGLVCAPSGEPIFYPQVTHLRFGVYSGVAINLRNRCPHQPFPKLEHLQFPGVFPFANDTLFRGIEKRLKSLTLAVSSHGLELFKKSQLSAPNCYTQLKSVDIHILPIEDPFLIPGQLNDDGLSNADIENSQRLALTVGSGLTSVRIDLGAEASKQSLFNQIRISPHAGTIKMLDLGATQLTIDEIDELTRLLPNLVHLKYTIKSILDSGVAVSVHSNQRTGGKLCQLTLMTNAAPKIADHLGAYVASVCAHFKSVIRFNVLSDVECKMELVTAYKTIINTELRYQSKENMHLHHSTLVRFKKNVVDPNYLYYN
ncbi:hypothetical protein GGF37_001484 [Kickxella alabastrina]|nr:hypothetical protein GGF37_001484 [Kickxella alabastrina]